MRLTRQKMSQYFSVCLHVALVAAVSVPSIQAINILSPDETLPTTTAPSPLGWLEDPLYSPLQYELPDTPSLHNYFVRPFPSLNSRSPEFLGFPDTPPRLSDAHEKQWVKTGTPTLEESVRLRGEAQYSEGQAKEATGSGNRSVSDPLRAFSSSKTLVNSLWSGPQLPTPFGFSKTDEWLTSILFHLWAALHPQDAAYYVNLSQRASSPALTPVMGLHDMLSVHDRFNPQSVPSQGLLPVDLPGTVLQNLLLELLTRTTNSAATSQTTRI